MLIAAAIMFFDTLTTAELPQLIVLERRLTLTL